MRAMCRAACTERHAPSGVPNGVPHVVLSGALRIHEYTILGHVRRGPGLAEAESSMVSKIGQTEELKTHPRLLRPPKTKQTRKTHTITRATPSPRQRPWDSLADIHQQVITLQRKRPAAGGQFSLTQRWPPVTTISRALLCGLGYHTAQSSVGEGKPCLQLPAGS